VYSHKAIFEALPVFQIYYYALSVVYLASSMVVGYAICCHLERDARAAFHRERELDRSNQTLVEARRDIENKTLALIAAKEELRTSAERANREKSKFLADAVHDLSQPTQAVSLLAESARLALARNDLGMASDLIELTGRAAKTAGFSFQAVLEISRLESGLIKPNRTVFTAQDVVAEAIAPLRVIAQAKAVKVRMRTPRDVRAMTFSDRNLLLRAVANLASNAIKYSDQEKGERQCVLIGVVPLPNRVRIDVIDNGIGMPESKWGEAFKPFVQLHNPEHNREKGLGLGLSIVHAIFAVLPDHRLDMRSAEGCGTRFSLELPRYMGTPISLAEVGASIDGMADLASLFVWHVEDDEITRVAIKALLTELGILVEQAASFEELERELPFTERRPDLVITDYLLPRGRTAEDVIAIFVRKWDADLPIIILTGGAGAVNGETIGSNIALLKKPASATDIVDAIRRLCFKNSSALEVAE
jgi:signal transduction histidine kinase/CheY-like chemotaxis protein